jgi:hypothetical protein
VLEKSIPLDEYENTKPWRSSSVADFVLTRQDREELLVEWGASFHEIIEAIRANIKAKNQRRRTVNAIGTYDRWEEVMENASRKIKQTLTLKKTKKLEDFIPKPTHKHSIASSIPSNSTNSQASPDIADTMKSTMPPKSRQRSASLGDESSVAANHQHELNGDGSLNQAQVATAAPKLPERRQSLSSFEVLRDDFSIASSATNLASDVGHTNLTAAAANKVVIEIDTAAIVQPPDDEDDNTTWPSNYEWNDDGMDDDSSFHSYHEYSDKVTMQAVESASNYSILDVQPDDDFVMNDEMPVFYVSEMMSVNTHMSEFTSEFNSTCGRSNGDGNFESLARDSSFWELRPGLQDSPIIQRKMRPVIISEDESNGGYYGEQQQPDSLAPMLRNPLHDTSYNVVDGRYRENDFTVLPPPNSASIISKWE